MRRNRRDFRGVGRPVGAVVTGLGIGIALCAAGGAAFDAALPARGPGGGVVELLASAAVTLVFGVPLYRWGEKHQKSTLTRREATLAVGLIWLAAGIFGALPFVVAVGMSPADAFFESVSGLTTTGATVITHIELDLSRPVLLWRSMLQWLGGMGIVVLFVAVFPTLGAGGKHMFKGEVPGTTAEGLRPRIAETSFALWKLYALFTAILFLVLTSIPGGMNAFEALCHSLTTMSTGGFSTKDSSIGGFDNAAIEYVVSTFMLLGSVNYGLYYVALKNKKLSVIRNSLEFRVFVVIVLVAVVAMTMGNLHLNETFEESFRNSLFMVATTISSTGFGSDDYTAYTPGVFAVLIAMMFIGGSSGSTAGGMKIERVVLLAKQSVAQIRKTFRPNVVEVIRMGRRRVSSPVMADVMAFFVVFMGCLAVGVLIVSLVEGAPVETSFGAMLTCLSNMGPAPFHLDGDHFAEYSTGSKFFFAGVMLLGRLEFFTLFALCVPEFWKR